MGLQNFQNHVPHSIFSRGEDYYENDLNKNYNSTENYEEYLKSLYPERILKLYYSKIPDYAERNMGRDHYQYVVSMLKKMKTYPGGIKTVNSIVSHFRKTYLKRRAMMEELEGI